MLCLFFGIAGRHICILQQVGRLGDAACCQVLSDRFAGVLRHLPVQTILALFISRRPPFVSIFPCGYAAAWAVTQLP